MIGCSFGLIAGYGNYNSQGFLKSIYMEKLDISETYFNLLFSIPSFVLIPTIPIMTKVNNIIGDRIGIIFTALLTCNG